MAGKKPETVTEFFVASWAPRLVPLKNLFEEHSTQLARAAYR